MSQVRIHPEAEQELRDAVAWYERQTRGLGRALLDAFDAAVEAIEVRPLTLPPSPGTPWRHVKLGRFPYALWFAKQGREWWIFAVAHGHRRPRYWAGRSPIQKPPKRSRPRAGRGGR